MLLQMVDINHKGSTNVVKRRQHVLEACKLHTYCSKSFITKGTLERLESNYLLIPSPLLFYLLHLLSISLVGIRL